MMTCFIDANDSFADNLTKFIHRSRIKYTCGKLGAYHTQTPIYRDVKKKKENYGNNRQVSIPCKHGKDLNHCNG